jgi:hypothetical protein
MQIEGSMNIESLFYLPLTSSPALKARLSVVNKQLEEAVEPREYE